jgi:hypothetical protein
MNPDMKRAMVRITLGMSLVFLAGLASPVWAQSPGVAPAEGAVVARQEAEDPVLVRIGQHEVIRASDVRDYARRRTDLRALLNTPTGQALLIEEIAMTRALVLEGERRQEPRAGEPVPGIDSRFDDVYALAVYRKVAGECKAPGSEAEALQYYEAHPQAFQLPAQARIERIILPRNLTLDKFPAELWLGLQARAVATSNARFEALIERAAEAAPDLRQGDLGWVQLEVAERQPILGAVQSAGIGGVVGPFVEGDYVYLLRVTDWRDAQVLPWEVVKHQVRTRAVQYCRETQRERVKTDLFQRYGVQIDKKALQARGGD